MKPVALQKKITATGLTVVLVGAAAAGFSLVKTTPAKPHFAAIPAYTANLSTVNTPALSNGPSVVAALPASDGRTQWRRITAPTVAQAAAQAAAIPGAQLTTEAPVHAASLDPDRSSQWDLDTLRMDSLTARPAMGSQLVAVLDSGIVATHEDWATGVVDCADGEDLTGDGLSTNGCIDPFGHGTAVAGTIAAASGNGLGIEGMAAVRILPIRVLDSSGAGSSLAVSDGIEDAVDKGATVINMSLAGPYASSYDTAIAYATAHHVVVVAAAGNNQTSSDAEQWPAGSPGAIAVGATDASNNIGYFSTSGPQVALSAPGVNILGLDGGISNTNYVYRSGTSQATPHVAALAAMILAQHPGWTPAQVLTLMESTATDEGTPGRDDYYGYGIINPLKALAATPSAPIISSVTAAGASALVNWATPADGGAAITGYTVAATPTVGTTVAATVSPTAARPYSLTGLTPGLSYSVTVTTTNGNGNSSPSSASVVTPTAGTTTTMAPATTTTVTPTTSTTSAPTTTITPAPAPAAPPTPAPVATTGYRLLSADGTVSTYGSSANYGSARGRLGGNAVALAATSDNGGYWVASAKGEVLAFGDATDYGSMAGHTLNQPVINMAVTPTGHGYWLLSKDGGVFSFGDAAFFGSTGSMHLNQPAVGITPTASGRGYWFVAADGGIFAFGDAQFDGSMGATHLNKPVVGMTVSTSGGGYRMVASDGGIFSFGDAQFYGSLGSTPPAVPVQAMQPTRSNAGYYMASQGGQIYSFGDAANYGGGASNVVAISY